MKQWTLSARLEYEANVMVEADTAEEAAAKAERGEFDDDGMAGASLANWVIHGKPHLSYDDEPAETPKKAKR